MKRIISYLLLICTIFSSFTTVNAATTEEHSTSQAEVLSTDVTASISSTFSVKIPKQVNIATETKSSTYTVEVTGDIATDERVNVIPESTFDMELEGKDPVVATVTQDKTSWKNSDLNVIGNGLIEVPNITTGKWEGSFLFNISLKSVAVTVVSAIDSNGVNLNASATTIEGEEREQLLNGLISSGLITSADDVDAIIDVQADAFDTISNTVFDVSNIAQSGDTVVILHFDEMKQEWEYIGTEVVDDTGKIAGDFTSYSPVVFVKVESAGDGHKHYYIGGKCYCGAEQTLAAGLYDADGNMICSWEESGIDVSIDYNNANYKTTATSGYFVLTNKYPNTTKVVIDDSVTTIGVNAFYGCSSLKEVIIPDSVASINDAAFAYCTSLENITLPKNITSLSKYLLYECKNLNNVTIPDNVLTIKEYALGYCPNLEKVDMSNSVKVIQMGAFINCSKLKDVKLPDSLVSLYNGSFRNCTSLTEVRIGENVTLVGNYAFGGCTNLTSVIFVDTEGWQIQTNNYIKSSDISNPGTAATYLKVNYVTYDWTKINKD